MSEPEARGSDATAVAQAVNAFYERHPYPPPVDDLDRRRRSWTNDRHRVDACLFWPAEPCRDDRRILVAGCATSCSAKVTLRWLRAQVIGIDVSASGIKETEKLKRKHGIGNLELQQLPVEHAAELGRRFEHVGCTGVLHHLPDPDQGLRAPRDVLAPEGAMHLMVYARYGRAGVHLPQYQCRRLGARRRRFANSQPACVRCRTTTRCCRCCAMHSTSEGPAQLSRTGLRCAQFASHASGCAASAPSSGPCGTTIACSLAFGASMRWKRVRCSLGRGTGAASRCMNSSGDNTLCQAPSRQGVFSFRTTGPAALHGSRSLASAGRVM